MGTRGWLSEADWICAALGGTSYRQAIPGAPGAYEKGSQAQDKVWKRWTLPSPRSGGPIG
jgi:hypothetical protein